MAKNMKKSRKRTQALLHAAFILISCMYVLPFLVVLSVSFTDEAALTANGYQLIPSEFSLEAYKLVFKDPTQILQAYQVTIIFTVVATILAIAIMGITAYPLSRRTFKYKKVFNMYILFTMLFNAGLVPNYLLIVRYLHLNDTIWVYILPGLVSAYYIFIIRTNYAGLPEELIEAAKIDGASELYTCFKIVMPLCMPVLASVGFLFLVAKWNDWNTSLLYIRDPELYSLQYMLQKILRSAEFMKQMLQEGQYVGDYVFPAESFRYAMAVVAAGPVLAIFPFFQKYFSKGMTIGGVKG